MRPSGAGATPARRGPGTVRTARRRSGGGGSAPAAPRSRAHGPAIGNRLVNFLQGSWRELQRVQWPDRRQVIQATAVVIGFVIVAGAYLGVADLVATKLMKFILG